MKETYKFVRDKEIWIACVKIAARVSTLNENRMMCGERKLRKNSKFQMGFEPTTFRTLVGCSNH